MIEVTTLSGRSIWINPHQIETAEAKPDTTLTMLSGKHIIVREDIQTLVERIVDYRRRLGVAIDAE